LLQQSNLVDKFLSYLHVERRLSNHTQKAYQRDLRKLADYCEAQNITSWQALDHHYVRKFVAEQHRIGLGGASLQRLLSAVRTFCEYLIREEILTNNPAIGIRTPKTSRKLPDVLDVDQTNQLLAFNDKDPLNIRDRAIMELFYSSGLRLSELVNLNVNDLDLNNATVEVTGKGNKTRILPVGRYACTALMEWFEQRQKFLRDSNSALFLSRLGRRISPRTIQLRIRERARKQGISTTVYPHLLRHSFASHMLESSTNLRAVQELLGHENIATTQIYTHLDFQHLAKVYDQAHPRAKKKPGSRVKTFKTP